MSVLMQISLGVQDFMSSGPFIYALVWMSFRLLPESQLTRARKTENMRSGRMKT